MENSKDGLEPLLEKAGSYLQTYFELNKLIIINKVANIFSSLVSRVVAAIFLVLFIISASVGAAFWLGELLGKVYYGFFGVAGFYALVI